MTHRDGFPRVSARSAWCGDPGHREPWATPSESLGKPPFRSDMRTAGGRRKTLTMRRIAGGFPPTRPLARRITRAISMGHYQRSLVLERVLQGPLERIKVPFISPPTFDRALVNRLAHLPEARRHYGAVRFVEREAGIIPN